MRNIAVFASGRGSNFQKIYQNIQQNEIPARVCCLITDNSKAGVLEFAAQNNIPYFIITPKAFSSSEQFGNELLKILKNFEVEFVILAGYLKKIPDNVVYSYSNKILNIHPALLPAFGGKGMYGRHVHQAVYNSGVKVSGVTVHLVNTEYDAGPVVMQEAVNIEKCKSPEEIAEKVLQVEHVLYSKAVKKILSTDYCVEGNRVILNE